MAHNYIENIGHEYLRLRARLHKLEASDTRLLDDAHADLSERLSKLEQSKDENMMKAYISADANALALRGFDALAAQIRKDNPSLTHAQAFEKAYTDPRNTDLRMIERNAFYKSVEAPLHYEQPIAKSVAPEESGAAYQAVMRKAEAAHKKDPSKSIAQHFSKIYCSDESLRRQDISERNVSKAGYPPVAETEPVVGQTDNYKELCAMAEKFRQNNPFISFAQAFARVGEANPAPMQRERKERYARMGMNV